jgi:hypothetical protein
MNTGIYKVLFRILDYNFTTSFPMSFRSSFELKKKSAINLILNFRPLNFPKKHGSAMWQSYI